MLSLDEIRLYLPKYLSPTSEKELFSEIEAFPNNFDSRFYSRVSLDETEILQGDGIRELLVINLPNREVRPTPAMVISNTCDVDSSNRRATPIAISYAPIFRLSKYLDSLREGGKSAEAITQHAEQIQKQRVTQVFFLPQGAELEEDSLVFLDRLNSCQGRSVARDTIPSRRLFTLSNYGAWLFLVKLSIHFTRMNDRIDRRIAWGER